ncbi:MAG: hypothetical protein ACH350_09245 [Parachlamydiaceae bacterium]
MRFFDRQFSWLILLATLPLLFLPKINLISVDAEETAGLRIDDFILFLFAILLMWAHGISHQRLYKIEGSILLITVFGLFSFLANRLLFSFDYLFMEAKIFYSLRLLEYFLFFYVGAFASQFFQNKTIVKALIIWIFLLLILQKLTLIGGMTSAGYVPDVSSRVPGLASFPSEMGLLLNLLFCYLVFDQESMPRLINLFESPLTRYILNKIYLYVLFCLFGLFIIFTGNRISILALILCFIFRIKQDLSLRSIGSYLSMMILIPIAALAIGFTISKTLGVYDRSSNLFSFKNLELFSIVWDKVDVRENPSDHLSLESKNYDMSWFIRIHKWLFMIKSYVESPGSYLQGLGPGYAGAALDGGLLRIATEYGLIGIVLFWKFFASLYRINRQTKWMIIAFAINMIFFDAYLAYKTMSFLLFTSGHLFERGLAEKKEGEMSRASISMC